MRLQSIRFDDGEVALPAEIVVSMSIEEAALVAKMLGNTSPSSRNEIMGGGGTAGTDIYDCLLGDVFNRYWEDGLSGHLRGDTQ